MNEQLQAIIATLTKQAQGLKKKKKNFTLELSDGQKVSIPVDAYYSAYKHNTTGKTIVVQRIAGLSETHWEVTMSVEEVTDFINNECN